MADTKVIIDANTVSTNGTNKYKLYAGCNDAGDLQDAFIFLVEIIDPGDEEEDELKRVCTVADMVAGGYYTNRQQAETAGHSLYRSNQMTKYYDDVQVANQAKTALRDSINTLIGNYSTYSNEYEAVEEEISFPTEDESYTDELKTAYTDALADYETALEDQATAATELDTATEEYEDAKTQIDKRDELKDDLDARISGISDSKTAFENYVNDASLPSDAAWIEYRIDAFVSDVDSFLAMYDSSGSGVPTYYRDLIGSQRDNMVGYRSDFQVYRKNIYNSVATGSFATALTNLQTLRATIDNYFLETDSTLSTKEGTLTAAKATKVAADAAVSEKYSLMMSAYRAAKAVCPEWTAELPPPPVSST